MSVKKALITGIAGQDGVYLAQHLLARGVEVHGLVRWDSDVEALARMGRFARAGLPLEDVTLHTGDVCDPHYMLNLFYHVRPDEIYNLAAVSHVAASFQTPSVALDIVTKGTLNGLEAMRRLTPEARFYQASSSEMFGDAPAPQSEASAMNPCSPYAIAKLAAYHLVRLYRQSYGLFAVNGILFNHESPLRAHDFVTQKIAQGAAAIQRGDMECLTLGNLNALRDWGHARDYVRGMHMMLGAERADDFVLATGQARSVRDFATAAFAYAGMPLTWQGQGLDEEGVDAGGAVRVRVSADLFRPVDVAHLCGDTAKAQAMLGWRPEISFEALVHDMVDGALGRQEAAPGKKVVSGV